VSRPARRRVLQGRRALTRLGAIAIPDRAARLYVLPTFVFVATHSTTTTLPGAPGHFIRSELRYDPNRRVCSPRTWSSCPGAISWTAPTRPGRPRMVWSGSAWATTTSRRTERLLRGRNPPTSTTSPPSSSTVRSAGTSSRRRTGLLRRRELVDRWRGAVAPGHLHSTSGVGAAGSEVVAVSVQPSGHMPTSSISSSPALAVRRDARSCSPGRLSKDTTIISS